MVIYAQVVFIDFIFGGEKMHYYYYYDENNNICFIESSVDLKANGEAEHLIEITREEYVRMHEELGMEPR